MAQPQKKDPKRDEKLVVTFGEERVNVAAALPLRVGDWRAMKAQGVTVSELSKGYDPDLYSLFAHFVIGKVRKQTTREEVDTMRTRDLLSFVGAVIDTEELAGDDRPT